MDLFSNPEVIRSARAQLRPGRMVTIGGICAALSLAVGFSMAYAARGTAPPGAWGMVFLKVVLAGQIVMLLIGGGVACLHAINREKEMNTFDFQRVTRLTPLELAVGKLFGAPAMTYFVVLCLMPAAVVGAMAGGARPTFFVSAYLILLLGSIVAHAFALLVSMVLERGAASAAVLLYLALVGMTSIAPVNSGQFTIGQLNAFFALDLVDQTDWSDPRKFVDTFFGLPVHHVLVLVVLYLTFTGWFLLALARNIKRDPAVYELYTPAQSLGLAVYVNLLLVGFFRWDRLLPFAAQGAMFGFNMLLFFVLGVALLRNRDRLRRQLRERGEQEPGWRESSWPAPYLLAGMLLVGLATIGMISWKRDPKAEWNLGIALFRLVCFSIWLVRDILYLQWVNLTRIRRPLVMGILYLFVYYTCLNILFGMLDLYRLPQRLAFTAIFVPSGAFALDTKLWSANPAMWIVALVCQAAVIFLFGYLQRQKLLELSARPTVAQPAD